MTLPLRSLLLLAAYSLACAKAPADGPPKTSAAAEASSPAEGGAKRSPEIAPAREPPGPPLGRGGTDELPHLEGKTEAELQQALGAPTKQREFPMSECCHEFEIELYNTYPPGKGHDAVRIREQTWDYDGYAVTVWLHQLDGSWIVLDTIRYRDDVEF